MLGLESSDDVRPLYFLAEVILPSEVLERHRIAPVTELGLDPRSTSLVALPQLAEERSSISTRMEKREGIAFMNVWGSGIRIGG